MRKVLSFSKTSIFTITCFILFAGSCVKEPIPAREKGSSGEAFTCLRKGDSILNSGDLYGALLEYDNGIELASIAGNDSLAAAMLLKQGKTYLKIGDIKTWKSYEKRLKEEYTLAAYPILELDYLRTSFQIDRGLQLARVLNDSSYLASFLIYKGRLTGVNGGKDSALLYFDEATNFFREQDLLNRFQYYAYKTELLIKTGDSDGVETLFFKMIPLIDILSDLEVEKQYWGLQADYTQMLKDTVRFHESSRKRDSLQYAQTNNIAVITLTEYQKRLDQLESQETIGFLQRRLSFFLLVFVFISILGSMFIVLFIRIRNQNRMLKQGDEYKLKILRILSHDLRGPLVDLIQNLEKKRHYDDSQKVAKILRTSDELLEWTYHELRSAEIELQDLDPVEIIEEVISNVGRLFSTESKQIIFEAPNEDWLIHGNPDILKFVIRNILTNALKFSSDSSVKIILQKNHKETRIAVKNTGPGFEHSKDHPARGKGLGLDLSKNLLGKTGASLRIEEDAGTTSVSIILKPELISD